MGQSIKIIGYSSDELPAPKKQKTLVDNSHCIYCGVKLYDLGNKTREHVNPRVRIKQGDVKSNILRPCCISCNQQKGNMLLGEYLGFIIKSNDVFRELKIINIMKLAKELEGKGVDF